MAGQGAARPRRRHHRCRAIAQSIAALTEWLEGHDLDSSSLHFITVDTSVDGLGVDPTDLSDVREIFHVAGAYRFGMAQEEARAANVDGSRRVVELAATLPALTRLVHLSGYRVGGQDPASVPWSPEKVDATYARLGAYEASKVESDAVVQASAAALGVLLTIANPSSVPALVGGSSTFAPVVTVDHLVRFMALLPTLKETRGQSYWILDDNTPALPDLLRLVGRRHRGAKVPRLRIPVWLLRRLPAAMTGAAPETLGFLSADRYPTGPANALAEAHGLHRPDVVTSLERWSDHLAGLASSGGPHAAETRT